MKDFPKRTAYPRRRDDFIHPGASANDHKIGNTLAPLDRAVGKSEEKWGIDRLQELVSPETAAKWGSALGKLNAAIDAQDTDTLLERVKICLKGLAAMDAEALARGHEPMPNDFMEYEHEGHRFAVIREARDWKTIKAVRPDLTLYSLREVALALQSYKSALPKIEAIKAAFPGAEITAVRSKLAEELEDDLPF